MKRRFIIAALGAACIAGAVRAQAVASWRMLFEAALESKQHQQPVTLAKAG